MSEVDRALNYIPLNEEGTDVTCGHGSRWIYWHQEDKWVDVVRRSDCTCPDPPSPEIIKQVAVDAENIEKYAPFWVKSIFKSLAELYEKYELLVGEISDLTPAVPLEGEDDVKVTDWDYDPDELQVFIEENERMLDEIIEMLKEKSSLRTLNENLWSNSDFPVRKRSIT